MKRNGICLAILLLLLAACTPAPAVSVANDVPAGTWSGDYGPDASRRDPVTLELRWEGTDLRGVVRSGPQSIPLDKASFKPETGAIILEFDAQNNDTTVRYVIDGKVEGNVMSGKWSHDAVHGDFRVTKQ